MNGNRIFAITGIALATAVPGFLAGVWLHEESTIEYKRGSSTVEFVTTQQAKSSRGATAAPRRPPPPLADVRPPRPADAYLVGFPSQAALPAALDVQGGPRARVPALDRVRPPVRRPAARASFYAFHHRTGKIVWQRKFNHCSAASPTVAYRVVYHSWMQPLPCNRFPRNQPGQVVAMAARTGKIIWRYRAGVFESSPLVVGKTLYVGSWDHKLHAINIYTGKARWTFTADARDQQLAGVRQRKDLLRYRRRQRLRAGRSYWTPALALAGARALRAPRVLLRHADDRLRPCVRREHGRHALRLRRLERTAAVGPARRQLHLHGGRGLAAPRLHRHLRRRVHGVRRGYRRPDLELPGIVGDPWRAERHRRSRLLRRLPALRPERFTIVQERRPRNLRARRADGTARLALARRSLQPGHRRQPAPLHRRALARLQLYAEASSRSSQESKNATSTAVKGQIKYEFWKTRPR